MEERRKIPKKNLIKFLFISLLGITAFMVPISYNGSTNTVVGVLTELLSKLINPVVDELILVLVSVSTIGSLLDYILNKAGKEPSGKLHAVFKTTIVYLLTKIFACAVTVMCYLGIGPEFIVNPDVGGTMLGLGKTLVALALSLSYLLPFLTDGGLMEFAGEVTKPVVRPLFKVPSDASLDLIASWLGASSAAVILSAEKYRQGFYSKREAAIVMCNFSLVSIPFCIVIATTAGVQQYFPAMYGLLCVLGVILAMILPRIYPLRNLKDEFATQRPNDSESDKEPKMFRRALMRSSAAAKNFNHRNVLEGGTNVMSTICMNLVPTVIAWGVVGLLVVHYTPIFQWLSLPMGWLMDVMGVESAYAAAPATLVGFVDMFIPALLVTTIESVRTRFIIATLSLIQIIYITEVGAVIIQTNLGVDIKRLFIVFLERTLISLPIIVLASMLIVH